VGGGRDAMEGEVGARRVEAAGDLVAEDVNGVPALGQRGGDLRGHDAAAAEGREADDADPERRPGDTDAWLAGLAGVVRRAAHGARSWSAVANGPTAPSRSNTIALSTAGPSRPASDGQA